MTRTVTRIGVGIVALAMVLSMVGPATAGVPAASATDSADLVSDGVLAAQEDGNETGADDGEAPPDPESDTIGWENGYWYNESIDVDQSDGLTDEEFDAYVSRAQARVEEIRQLEFTEDVPVEVVSRADYVNDTGNVTGGVAPPSSAWNNQVWEALFIVSESANVSTELEAIYGGNVLGYYSPSEDRIVVVSDNPDQAVLDNATLHHELVHALQDQQFNLSDARFGGETQDSSLAASGIVEGDANYVETTYIEKCGTEYDCVETPQGDGAPGGGAPINFGIYSVIIHPYSDGQAFVADLYERGGWEAVNDAYATGQVPSSTEQVIDPAQYPDEMPDDVPFEDTSSDGWKTFEEYNATGVNGSDTVGETSVFSMLWYQGYGYGTPVINSSTFLTPDDPPYDFYNYSSAPSQGWGGDRVTPYYSAPDDGAETFGNETDYGYVWRTQWDGEDNATEFKAAYVATLEAHNATEVAENTYVIPDSDGFADAFYVCQNGDSVVIVNAPSVDELSEIKPDFDIPEDASMEDGNETGEGESAEEDSADA